MLRVREDAIIDAVNRLLAEKGFDAMTVDQIAADVGIAKASLYKHFASKEALAAAAMVRVLQRAADVVKAQPASLRAIDKVRAVTRWALELPCFRERPSPLQAVPRKLRCPWASRNPRSRAARRRSRRAVPAPTTAG